MTLTSNDVILTKKFLGCQIVAHSVLSLVCFHWIAMTQSFITKAARVNQTSIIYHFVETVMWQIKIIVLTQRFDLKNSS